MVHHNSLKRRFVSNAADPVWKLRVPDRSVATDELVVSGSPVDKVVCSAQGEGTTRTLCRIPLHAVLRCDLSEVVDDQLGVGAAGQKALVGRDTNVLLALRLERGIDRTLCSILA